MTTVYVLNDTSAHDHAGCRAVMQSLYARLAGAEIVGRHFVGQRLDDPGFRDADLVVCNGEGTLHHGKRQAVYLMECLRAALRQGRRAILVNAVWQEMGGWGRVLGKLDRLYLREPMSTHQALDDIGPYVHGPVECCPDLCLDVALPPTRLGPYAGQEVLGGVGASGMRRSWPGLEGRIPNAVSLRGQSLQSAVDELAGAALYVTGQHHGVYAAAIAGVPFRCCRSNSWKIEALLNWYDPEYEWPADEAWCQRPTDWYAGFSEWLLALPRMPRLIDA